jgi:hypothetical protein
MMPRASVAAHGCIASAPATREPPRKAEMDGITFCAIAQE